MESLGFVMLICIPPLLILVGTLGGFVGGKALSRVLRKLDSKVSKDVHDKIIKRSTFGFFIGATVGGILLTWGLLGMMGSFDVSPRDAIFVAIGFAIMGAIGTTITGSALFFKD